jgi:hypothetical protein
MYITRQLSIEKAALNKELSQQKVSHTPLPKTSPPWWRWDLTPNPYTHLKLTGNDTHTHTHLKFTRRSNPSAASIINNVGLHTHLLGWIMNISWAFVESLIKQFFQALNDFNIYINKLKITNDIFQSTTMMACE